MKSSQGSPVFNFIFSQTEDDWSRDTRLVLVKHFNKHNMISDDELKKYYLDETGEYVPKLKTNQN